MRQQQIDYEKRLDHFADLLALDIPLSDIAERMGVRTARVSQLLMAVRARLGAQAI